MIRRSRQRTRIHGLVGSVGVIVEDGVQLVLTCYVELYIKADVLVVAGGVGGISKTAALSVVFGLGNAVFKVVEGIHRFKTGPLGDVTADTTAVKYTPSTHHPPCLVANTVGHQHTASATHSYLSAPASNFRSRTNTASRPSRGWRRGPGRCGTLTWVEMTSATSGWWSLPGAHCRTCPSWSSWSERPTRSSAPHCCLLRAEGDRSRLLLPDQLFAPCTSGGCTAWASMRSATPEPRRSGRGSSTAPT